MKCKLQNEKPDGYHFIESGLDYVYLVNGYDVEVDEDGDECVTIHNADTLMQEIARNIVLHKTELKAQELKFLRSLLNITQKNLAQFLGVTSREIQRWEDQDDENNIKAGNDGMLRILVWEKYLGGKDALAFLESCKAKRKHYQMMKLMELGDTWKLAA
jgi:putative transcriptional regulator